jgi:hypothetical protein
MGRPMPLRRPHVLVAGAHSCYYTLCSWLAQQQHTDKDCTCNMTINYVSCYGVLGDEMGRSPLAKRSVVLSAFLLWLFRSGETPSPFSSCYDGLTFSDLIFFVPTTLPPESLPVEAKDGARADYSCSYFECNVA